jgi:protein-tyrosine-phosphatase
MQEQRVNFSRQRSRLTVGRLVAAIRRRIAHRLVLRTARQASSRAVERAVGRKVLVLCYGNIYRSPLVHYLLRNTALLSGYFVESAGFFPLGERPCEPRYLALLASRGYDLHDHRSAVVSRQQLAAADIIIIMDRKNWQQLCYLDPSAAGKVVWIGAFNEGGPVEVEDPYGKNDAQVMSIVEQLEAGAATIAARLAATRGRADLLGSANRQKK